MITIGADANWDEPDIVDLDIDLLYENDMPHISFWMYCALNNWLMPDPDNKGKYRPTFYVVRPLLSMHPCKEIRKQRNQTLMEIIEKFDFLPRLDYEYEYDND